MSTITLLGYLNKIDFDKIARIISTQPIGKFRINADIQQLNNVTANPLISARPDIENVTVSKESQSILSHITDRRVFKRPSFKKIF